MLYAEFYCVFWYVFIVPLRKVCKRVAEGELSSGFAIVRPPGHHAEADEAMGFCLFNNIAIGAHFLLDKASLLF